MFCEKCGNQIEPGALFCTECGHKVEQTAEFTENTVLQEETVVATEELGTKPSKKEKKEKKKMTFGRAMKRVGIVIAAVIGGFLLVQGGRILANTIHKTIAPESYYRSVEKKYVVNLAESLLGAYDSGKKTIKKYDSFGLYADANLSVGDDLMTLVGMSGINLGDMLDDFGLKITLNKSDELWGLDLALKNGKNTFLSPKAVCDTKEGELYVSVPEFSEETIQTDFYEFIEVDEDTFEDAEDLINGLPKLLPKSSKVKKMLGRYVEAALEAIGDNCIEKSSATIKADGVKQRCTVFTIELDAKDMYEVREAFFEAMMDDEDFEDLYEEFKDVFALADYDDFVEYIEDDLGWEKNYADESDDEFVMKVYVDSFGKVCGREIQETSKNYYEWGSSTEDYTYTNTTRILTPSAWGKWGFEYSTSYDGFVEYTEEVYSYAIDSYEYYEWTEEYGGTTELVGSGTMLGTKISGELVWQESYYSVEEGETAYGEPEEYEYKHDYGTFEVTDIDLPNLFYGKLNGKITYRPSEEMLVDMQENLSEGLQYSDLTSSQRRTCQDFIDRLEDLTVVVDFAFEKNKGAVSAMLALDKKIEASLNLSYGTLDAKTPKVPSDAVEVEDMDDVYEWLSKQDLDAFPENLEAAGAPDIIVESLEILMDVLKENMEYYME